MMVPSFYTFPETTHIWFHLFMVSPETEINGFIYLGLGLKHQYMVSSFYVFQKVTKDELIYCPIEKQQKMIAS